MSGDRYPLILYAFMAWKRITYHFHLYSLCVIYSEDARNRENKLFENETEEVIEYNDQTNALVYNKTLI
jgi:hypothetical protein